MSVRHEHKFQFSAEEIAKAAAEEAQYHEDRTAYWQGVFDKAYAEVEKSIGAKITKQSVTQGEVYNVVVDYGDPDAYRRMNLAQSKLETHKEQAERLRTDAKVYGTQGDRTYDLDTSDVHYYRLGGGPRED